MCLSRALSEGEIEFRLHPAIRDLAIVSTVDLDGQEKCKRPRKSRVSHNSMEMCFIMPENRYIGSMDIQNPA